IHIVWFEGDSLSEFASGVAPSQIRGVVNALFSVRIKRDSSNASCQHVYRHGRDTTEAKPCERRQHAQKSHQAIKRVTLRTSYIHDRRSNNRRMKPYPIYVFFGFSFCREVSPTHPRCANAAQKHHMRYATADA